MARKAVEDILSGDISKIYRENKYFPLHLAINDDADLQFILGVRGDGKTFNAKKQILKDWFERKIKSYWIIPYKNEMEELMATKDFHLDLLIDELMIPDEEWDKDEYGGLSKHAYVEANYSEDDIYCHNLATKVGMRKEFLVDTESNENYEDCDWFMRMIPLSMYAKYKKGKHPRVNRIYFDEFMREDYLKNEAFKTIDLLTSVQREKKDFKAIFLGNAISLNHPMFVALNVWQLEEDKVITVIHDDKGKLGKIWRWKRPEDQAEEKNGNLLWYRIGEVTGYNDYAVKNNFKNDNGANIVQFSEEDMTSGYIHYKHTFLINDIYISAYSIEKEFNSQNKRLFWFKIEKDPKKIKLVEYAIYKDSVQDGVIYDPNMAWDIAGHIMKDRIWYDSIVTKQYIYEAVKTQF